MNESINQSINQPIPWSRIEAASSLVVQEITSLLWNTEVRCHIHNSPTMAPILNQLNPVRTPTSNLNVILILSSYLRLSLSGCLLPADLQTKILSVGLFPSTIFWRKLKKISGKLHRCFSERIVVANKIWS
jgi:hypothetical protein